MQKFVGLLGNTRRFTIAIVTALTISGVQESVAAPFDLTMVRSRTATTLSVEQRFFPEDDCAVLEGCVRAPGLRTLLRFDVSVANVGRGDLVLGDPTRSPNRFTWSPCHGHYHFRSLITYEIYDMRGRITRRGAKQAYCLRDNFRILDRAAENPKYDCEFQGLQAGWEDVYDKGLDCQWIDITGLKPGAYVLKAYVNRGRRLPERNFRNNSFTLRITIPRDVGTADSGGH
jgi:hypothetical protein